MLDSISLTGQVPVLDTDGLIQRGAWTPPPDAATAFTFALEPHYQRQVYPPQPTGAYLTTPSRFLILPF